MSEFQHKQDCKGANVKNVATSRDSGSVWLWRACTGCGSYERDGWEYLGQISSSVPILDVDNADQEALSHSFMSV